MKEGGWESPVRCRFFPLWQSPVLTVITKITKLVLYFLCVGNQMHVKPTCVTECVKQGDEKPYPKPLPRLGCPGAHNLQYVAGIVWKLNFKLRAPSLWSISFFFSPLPPPVSLTHGIGMTRRKSHHIHSTGRCFDSEDLFLLEQSKSRPRVLPLVDHTVLFASDSHGQPMVDGHPC